jgi:hypothetical protein
MQNEFLGRQVTLPTARRRGKTLRAHERAALEASRLIGMENLGTRRSRRVSTVTQNAARASEARRLRREAARLAAQEEEREEAETLALLEGSNLEQQAREANAQYQRAHNVRGIARGIQEMMGGPPQPAPVVAHAPYQAGPLTPFAFSPATFRGPGGGARRRKIRRTRKKRRSRR